MIAMNRADIEENIAKLGIPFAYRQFTEKTAVSEPFLVWYFDNSDNFSADNIVYSRIYELNLELYTGEKDFALEEQIENILTDMGLFWEKEEQWIESEKLFEVLYYMEVLYAGDEKE